ncbi:unnamed protein product [Sphagnum troendelagicum]
MGKKGKKPWKQKVEDFPPLTPPSGSPRSPTKNQLFAMITELKGNHEAKITKLEGNIEELKANHEQLKVGSKVMGLSLREYQELSRRCINLRNSIAHFATIEALEVAVAHSAHAIKIFPDFWTQLPDQCGVIERYP